MTPLEKLSRVEELFAARAAITAELLALMGGKEQSAPESPSIEVAADGKKQRKCSVCDQPGHTAKTCKRNAPQQYGFSRDRRKPEKRGPCSECGSKGTRHFKTCSKAGKERSITGNAAWAALDDVPAKLSHRMSKHHYAQVKEAQKHDLPADAIARELGVKLKEVNDAIVSYDYETRECRVLG
jgi:hypothetical protein